MSCSIRKYLYFLTIVTSIYTGRTTKEIKTTTKSTSTTEIECPTITCGPGYVLIVNPPGNICPYCERVTTPTTSTTHGCPQIMCIKGYTRIEDPTGHLCPKCVPTTTPTKCNCPTCQPTTTPSTTTRICYITCAPQVCQHGYELLVDPTGCTCPKCVPITTTTITPTCSSPPPCTTVQCEEGYQVVYDPTKCTCPTCQPVTPTPEIHCNGQTTPRTTSTTKRRCGKRRHPCPRSVKCPEGYRVFNDPTNCDCLTCQKCPPRFCPEFVRICDPNNPPPPPPPCGCPVRCVYPTTNPTTETPIICTTPACPWPTCTFNENNNTITCTVDQSYLDCKCDPYECTTPNNCPNIDIHCGPMDPNNPPFCGCPSCYFPPPPPPSTTTP